MPYQRAVSCHFLRWYTVTSDIVQLPDTLALNTRVSAIMYKFLEIWTFEINKH